MIDFSDLSRFCAALEREIERLEARWTESYRLAARMILQQLAEQSPQWSGNFAANWSVSLNGMGGFKYDEWTALTLETPLNSFDGANIRFRGDPQAVNVALARSVETLKKIQLGTTVYYGNLTPYGEAVANNRHEIGGGMFLRPGNFINPAPYPIGSVTANALSIFSVATRGA